MRAVEENTAWQVAFEIAVERDKNVRRLCKAVLDDQFETAKLLAKELKDEQESIGTVESINRRAGRRG